MLGAFLIRFLDLQVCRKTTELKRINVKGTRKNCMKGLSI